jgi:drug/metabolite transporter (DMT)-like permease
MFPELSSGPHRNFAPFFTNNFVFSSPDTGKFRPACYNDTVRFISTEKDFTMKMTKQALPTGHLMALICVLVWGSSFVVSKGLMFFLQPVQLMLLRFLLAYCALWIIHPKWYFKWKEEWRFLLMALFSNTIYFLAENTALTLTQTTNVSILVSTTPLVTALLLPLLYKEETPTGKQAAGFAVSFIGVVLVAGGVLIVLILTGKIGGGKKEEQ